MNKNIILFYVLLCAGCMSVSPKEDLSTQRGQPLATAGRVDQIKDGMTYQEICALMGEGVIVGYEVNDNNFGDSIDIKNPYREEAINVKGKVYQVAYFLTRINNADGLIADDELTPVVFEDNHVVGKGSDFLFKLKNR